MADKGFYIVDRAQKIGLQLNMRPFAIFGAQRVRKMYCWKKGQTSCVMGTSNTPTEMIQNTVKTNSKWHTCQL